MKRILVTVLCSLPLIASAVTLGGFEFANENIIKQFPEEQSTLLTYETKDGNSWIGWHFKNHFKLFRKARGNNKAWNILSAEKGKYLSLKSKARSFLVLTEYDCEEGRVRGLQITSFTGYFKSGDIINVSNVPRDWEYVQDSNINILFACKFLK